MEQITAQQFVNKILERPGAIILTFTSTTEPKLKKTWTGPKVYKQSTVNGIVNYNYQDAVNRQRVREGLSADFVSEPRTWGERVSGTPFILHNGQVYFTVKIQSTKQPVYVDAEGNTILVDELRPHFYAKSNSSRQGVEDEVVTRDYALGNITSLTLNGIHYILVHRDNVVINF